MLKTYEELRKIDVSKYCDKRDGVLYLNWAVCMGLLHENGASVVYWEPVPDPATGSSLRMTSSMFTDKNGVSNRCYETRIRVVIDDLEFEIQTPVMNGQNPVKDNSMSQIRVWNSMCRAFVKGVAMRTGLGFDLWLKEEHNPFAEATVDTADLPVSEAKYKTIEQLCSSHGISLEGWLKNVNRTRKTLTNGEAAAMLTTLKSRYGDD